MPSKLHGDLLLGVSAVFKLAHRSRSKAAVNVDHVEARMSRAPRRWEHLASEYMIYNLLNGRIQKRAGEKLLVI